LHINRTHSGARDKTCPAILLFPIHQTALHLCSSLSWPSVPALISIMVYRYCLFTQLCAPVTFYTTTKYCIIKNSYDVRCTIIINAILGNQETKYSYSYSRVLFEKSPRIQATKYEIRKMLQI
jgi:hypothetical protein